MNNLKEEILVKKWVLYLGLIITIATIMTYSWFFVSDRASVINRIDRMENTLRDLQDTKQQMMDIYTNLRALYYKQGWEWIDK